MASIFVTTNPPSEIDYSIIDGRIRSFMLRGEKLYDEQDGTAKDGWQKDLTKFVQEHHFGSGHAFMVRMKNDGLLPD